MPPRLLLKDKVYTVLMCQLNEVVIPKRKIDKKQHFLVSVSIDN